MASATSGMNAERSAMTLSECLAERVPNFYTGGKPAVQIMKDCMGQVGKRDEVEADMDVLEYTIDGGKKKNIVV